MTKLRLANTLRYLAIPFAIVTLWSWLQPAYFPSWAFGSFLFVSFCLLAPSIIIRSANTEL